MSGEMPAAQDKQDRPKMVKSVSLQEDGEEEIDGGNGDVGEGHGNDGGKKSTARARKSLKRQMTVQRIAKAFKESPRDAEVDRKVKERLESAQRWQRIGYLSVLLILVLILIVQIIQLVIKYIEGPTYMTTDVVPQPQAIFPAVTFCPEGNAFKDDVLKANGVEFPDDYNEKNPDGYRSWSSNDSSVDEEHLFRAATVSLEEMLHTVYIRYFRANATTGKFNIEYKDLSSEHLEASFTENRHRPFGRCYTLHPEPAILNLGVYYMKIKFRRPLKVYFHRHGQFLDLSGRMGHKIYPGEVTQTQVNYEDIRMLPKSTGKPNGEMTCANSTYDTCMNQALESLMLEESGCVVPWLVSQAPICTEPNSMEKTFHIHYNRVTNQFGDCPTPCETLLVNIGGKNVKERSKGADLGEVNSKQQFCDVCHSLPLYLYFSPRVILTEEHFLYDFVTLLAEVGGYVGLLLGFSFAHFLKWFNVAFEQTVRTWEMNKIIGEEERKKASEDAAKENEVAV